MRHHNSVLHDVLKLVPWDVFARLVAKHGTDELVRTFTTKHQFIALLFAQLSGLASLRDIDRRADEPCGAALSRWRPGAAALDAGGCQPQPRPRCFRSCSATCWGWRRARIGARPRTCLLIDSTRLRLAGQGVGTLLGRGVRRQGARGLRSGSRCPIYHAITAAKSTTSPPPRRCRSSRAPPMCLILATMTMRGGPSWPAGCRIVTRFKTNTPLNDARALPLAPDAQVLSDRIGFLPARQARSRKNPMRRRCARSASGSRPASGCASSPTTSTPRRRRSPISTSGAGRSSCSSAGSSRT